MNQYLCLTACFNVYLATCSWYRNYWGENYFYLSFIRIASRNNLFSIYLFLFFGIGFLLLYWSISSFFFLFISSYNCLFSYYYRYNPKRSFLLTYFADFTGFFFWSLIPFFGSNILAYFNIAPNATSFSTPCGFFIFTPLSTAP